MPIPTIQGQAGLVADPELRFTTSGKAVLSLRLAFNDSRFDEQTRQWETTRTLYLDGSAWEQTAERLADVLRKGDQVYVEGRLETQQWEKDGQVRSKPHLIVRTARKFEKAPQQQSKQSQQGGFQQQPPQQGVQPDPWSGTRQTSVPGDFGAPQGQAPPF